MDILATIKPTKRREGAPAGNTHAMKFKTPEERQELGKRYIEHLKKGLPKEYFPDADPQTMRRYIKDFDVDFDTEAIAYAEREGKLALITTGYAGITGKIKGFNANAWKFATMNMTKWSIKTDVTSDGQRIEMPVLHIPAENEI